MRTLTYILWNIRAVRHCGLGTQSALNCSSNAHSNAGRAAGVRYGESATLQYSSTPPRPIEDEDDDENENEAPHEAVSEASG